MAPTAGAPPVVLIANRAEIACRVVRACRKLGVKSVAAFTEPDRGTAHTKQADAAVCLGDKAGLYTSIPALMRAAAESGATAVHPGYGFLSESPEFVAAVEGAGMQWLGPRGKTMSDFALKHVAKDMAVAAGVPILEGSPLVATAEEAVEAAEATGYPVLIKATGGGGGMGIYKCFAAAEVKASFPLAVSQGKKSFGNGDVFIEKYIESAKHIEVQVFGDGEGHVVALGERECSVQRRHQKVIEECPSPFVDAPLREALCGAAVALCAAARYRSAGTVEFLVDAATKKFYFLEVNTRLQVEHGITELVTGTDVVEMMLRLQLEIPEGTAHDGAPVAASTPQSAREDLKAFELSLNGHAIECRLCAEDPCHDLCPASGVLGEVAWPEGDGVRVDTWVVSGTNISPNYDSLIAKVMTHADTRERAVERMLGVLRGMRVKGIPTNAQLCAAVLENEEFLGGRYDTHLLLRLPMQPCYAEVLSAGVMTTVQDYPGRTRLWRVGVPPSGPMDPLSLRFANALLGNEADAAALECTLKGPTLKFHRAARVAVCGGAFPVTLDGAPVDTWAAVEVSAGGVLDVGTSHGGVRCYVAVDGGWDAPVYLGSRSTFPGGNLGGYQGRPLQTGDVCELGPARPRENGGGAATPALPKAWRPQCDPPGGAEAHSWTVRMLPGPQAAPDYFTERDMQALTSAPYEVHYNSNRLGIRLTGPKPEFARADGGEGGGHPSNVHDHVYALGTINMSGDMPIILTVDGPSLGGFVCPATTITADMWRWGHMRPGDTVRFAFCSLQEAFAARQQQDARVRAVCEAAAQGGSADASQEPAAADAAPREWPEAAAVLRRGAASTTRLAGDRYVFVEFGDEVLDFCTRAKVAELQAWLEARAPPGVVECSPGVRSAHIEYDARALPLAELLRVLERAEAALPDVRQLKIESRVLHLPMAFRESKSKDAMQRYASSVRPEAVYLPDNVPFVAANNGLGGGVDALKKIVFDASYMVFGLGDVYLGAPCAVPINPLHRLVTPKYNPARTFTWEGTVGLGGAYMCIYPMNSPGGYQLIGRTLPIWSTHGHTAAFTPEKPWLLEIFDQIKFHEVPEAELETLRARFSTGAYELEITREEFDFGAHAEMCASLAEETAAWTAQQRAAAATLAEEDAAIMGRLEAGGYKVGGGAGVAAAEDGAADDLSRFEGDEFRTAVAPFVANVWQVAVAAGDTVEEGQALCVLEAMKVETAVAAPCAGTVAAVGVAAGAMVQRGQALVVVRA